MKLEVAMQDVLIVVSLLAASSSVTSQPAWCSNTDKTANIKSQIKGDAAVKTRADLPATSSNSAQKSLAITRYMKAMRMDQKLQKMISKMRDRQTEFVRKLMEEGFDRDTGLSEEDKRGKIEAATKFLVDRSWELVLKNSDPAGETENALKMALATEYTAEELNGIAAFYESPTGQKVLDSSDALSAFVLESTTEKLRPATKEIFAEELKKIGLPSTPKPPAEATSGSKPAGK